MHTIKTANSPFFLHKIESIRTRARLLTELRRAIGLKPAQDIRTEQWEVLENQLATISNKIRRQLQVYTDKYLSEQHEARLRPVLLNRLGELEQELTQAYAFYDTFMDILTQRLSDTIGPLLRGCDALAADGLHRGFLAEVTTMPLVFCERGFGASTLREGVSLLHQAPNPIPFIAIPYARLMEKYNLISIYHEVGHQAMAKLNLVNTFQEVYADAATKAGAAPILRTMFANWSKELLPDFWAFAHTGMAHTSSIRDVLLLPNSLMFQMTAQQQHPPAYLRFLASVEWCRCLWGKGDWDDWAAEWEAHYLMTDLDALSRQAICAARQLLPTIARATIQTKFRKFGGKPLSSLFDFGALEPARLKSLANPAAVTAPGFSTFPLGVQLAAFRLLRESRAMRLPELDARMTQWIIRLPDFIS